MPVLWSIEKRPTPRVAAYGNGPSGDGLENNRGVLNHVKYAEIAALVIPSAIEVMADNE